LSGKRNPQYELLVVISRWLSASSIVERRKKLSEEDHRRE